MLAPARLPQLGATRCSPLALGAIVDVVAQLTASLVDAGRLVAAGAAHAPDVLGPALTALRALLEGRA